MRTLPPMRRLPVAIAACLVVTACGGDGGQDVGESRPASQPAGSPTTQQPAAAPEFTGTLPEGVTGEMVQQGQQVFNGAGICYTCHGPNGAGTALGPAMTDGDWIWVNPDEDLYPQLVTIIQTGVAQPRDFPAPMPPMGGAQLNEDQVRAVAAYVYSLTPQ